MEKYILALDQGTTSSRALFVDRSCRIRSIEAREFTQFYPQPGWVEHDAEEIWSTQLAVAGSLIAKNNFSSPNIPAIGITNQRETTIVWNRQTGRPVCKGIVWQDRRTSAFCDRLKKEGFEPMIRRKTGLLLDAYFSATKIKWILDHVPGAKTMARQGQLAFGTVDSWLVWNLTGGKEHITDITNASRTMLYNIKSHEWDPDLLKLFGVHPSMLPEVKSSSEVYGETACDGLPAGIPIAGIAGDQQSALFGQMCISPRMVKNTYGTGCFMLMNIGKKPMISKNKLVTTIAWKIGNDIQYALEGSIFVAGAVVQWLRDGLGIIKSSGEVETLALKVPDSGGVYIVPAFTGLGAPYWNQDARGTIVGITRGTTDAHIARAAVESIALQTVDVLKAMEADTKLKIRELRVDGGATVNNLLMQFQADVLGATVVRPKITEITAIGAAYLAGLATGYWNSINEISSEWQVDWKFEPQKSAGRDEKLLGWHRAIDAAVEASRNPKKKR